MKFIYSALAVCLLLAACQPQPDNSGDEAFAKNSETVKAYLKAFQAENVDYSIYADDFVSAGTSFGAKDSLSLDEMKEGDRDLWAAFDLKLLDGDNVNLLPGVNPTTRKPNGSVRYYGDWEITLPATDSTEAKSGVLRLYESFDFNEEGKIIFQQVYGDFTGVMMYLNNPEQ